MQGSVLAVPNVIDAYSYDNSGVAVTVGGVLLAANSIYVCVNGGTPAAVGKAIWTNKGSGCGYTGVGALFNGTISGTTLTVSSVISGTIAAGQTLFDTTGVLAAGTTVVSGSGTTWTISPSQTVSASEVMTAVSVGYQGVMVQDTNSGYSPPYPSYVVVYALPTALPITMSVNIANSVSVPSNALQQIQTAVQAAFNGQDGGARARIGSTVFASRFYAGIAALGTWAQIRSIQIGATSLPSSTFVATLSTAGALTVSSVTTGTIAIGQQLFDTTGALPAGATITAGSGTSWTVSPSPAVAVTSETMYGVVSNQNYITANINQAPALNSANVTLTLS